MFSLFVSFLRYGCFKYQYLYNVFTGTLGATLARHRSKPRVYIGCMKSGPVLHQKYFFKSFWFQFQNSDICWKISVLHNQFFLAGMLSIMNLNSGNLEMRETNTFGMQLDRFTPYRRNWQTI